MNDSLLCEVPQPLQTIKINQKRKHKTLSLADKCTILKRLDDGESARNLSREYNVGRSTISDLKKNGSKILSYTLTCEEGADNKRQTMKLGDYPLLDAAVYEWFLQERCHQTTISNAILREKAKFFQTKIYPHSTNFKASEGWLEKFKKRHGIRNLTTTEEKLSSNPAAVEPFKQRFIETIKSLNFELEQIYNAIESELFWRLLPDQTLVHNNESQTPGQKISKDRITFMPCANATGNHKLPMLIIGKSKNPRAFKNCTLPFLYKGEAKGWMNVVLFKEWFHEAFVPSVKKHLESKNLEQKAILLIDNCPGHPDECDLVSDDGQIRVMFFPPHCTSLLQPMDQHVIRTIKQHYRKALLLHVFAQEGDVVQSLKMLNLKDAAFFLVSAWDAVQSKTIYASWSLLLGNDNSEEKEFIDMIDDDEAQMFSSLIKKINPAAAIDKSEVTEWIGRTEENIFMHKTDEDIIQSVLEVVIEEEEEKAPATEHKVKHEEAVSHFNHCIAWANENNIPWQQILLLQRLREEAMHKSIGTTKLRPN